MWCTEQLLLRFDWLKEMQFPDSNIKEVKQPAHAYWSITTKREPERERQPIRHPVNANLVILVKERSRKVRPTLVYFSFVFKEQKIIVFFLCRNTFAIQYNRLYNRLHSLQTWQDWPVSWLARSFVNEFKISKPMTRCILITCVTLLDFLKVRFGSFVELEWDGINSKDFTIKR